MQLIVYKRCHPDVTQEDMALIFSAKFGRPISRSCIQRKFAKLIIFQNCIISGNLALQRNYLFDAVNKERRDVRRQRKASGLDLYSFEKQMYLAVSSSSHLDYAHVARQAARLRVSVLFSYFTCDFYRKKTMLF